MHQRAQLRFGEDPTSAFYELTEVGKLALKIEDPDEKLAALKMLKEKLTDQDDLSPPA